MIKYIMDYNLDTGIDTLFPNAAWCKGGKLTYTAYDVKETVNRGSGVPFEQSIFFDTIGEATDVFNAFEACTRFYWGGGMHNPCFIDASYAQLSEWECDEDGEPYTCLRIIGFKAADAEPINLGKKHLDRYEAYDFACDLDWGNPYEDPEDMRESLRTNLGPENEMDEESIEAVYEAMCELWDRNHDEN